MLYEGGHVEFVLLTKEKERRSSSLFFFCQVGMTVMIILTDNVPDYSLSDGAGVSAFEYHSPDVASTL